MSDAADAPALGNPVNHVTTFTMKPMVVQLQEDITSGRRSMTELLRLAKLMSAKLELTPIQEWIEYELRGYRSVDSLPDYRFVSGGQLQFHNPYHGWLLASGDLPLEKLPVFQSMPEVENLTRNDTVYLIPPVRLPLTDLSGSSDLISALPQRIALSSLSFVKIIESVRDRLLDWSIELERQGIRGENMEFKEEEKQTAQNLTVNFIEKVTGNVGSVSHSHFQIYDYSSIHKTLRDHGVPVKNRNELEEIMDNLKQSDGAQKESWLLKAKDWVVKNQDFLGASASIVRSALGL